MFINTLVFSFLLAAALSLALFINMTMSSKMLVVESDVIEVEKKLEGNQFTILLFALLASGSPEDSAEYSRMMKPASEEYLDNHIEALHQSSKNEFLGEMLDFLRDQDETHPSQTYFQSAIDK